VQPQAYLASSVRLERVAGTLVVGKVALEETVAMQAVVVDEASTVGRRAC
jgi:hypothetical protein